MKTTAITLIDGNNKVTANFIRSEDAGYSAGRLLLDLPNGSMISVKKSGRKWMESLIENNICKRTVTHNTKAEALNSAAYELLAVSINNSAN